MPSTISKPFRRETTSVSTEYRAHGRRNRQSDLNASKTGGRPEIQGQSLVRSAGSRSWFEAPRQSFAEDTVESVIVSAFPEDVYNLTVEEQPEYFASGLLVHNCEYVPGMEHEEGGSPDRMDALVWAITELLIDQEQQLIGQRFAEGYQISPV